MTTKTEKDFVHLQKFCLFSFFFHFVLVLCPLQPPSVTKLIGKDQWKLSDDQPRRLHDDAGFRCLFKFCERCAPLINRVSSFNEAHCWSCCSGRRRGRTAAGPRPVKSSGGR